MKAKIWRYYFGRNFKEVYFAFLSAVAWTLTLELLDYPEEDEWLAVVILGYICGMLSRFLLCNLVLKAIESRMDYAVVVQKEREEALLTQFPALKVVAVVARALGVVTGLVMIEGSVVGLTFILTDALLLRLQLPSLGTTFISGVWVCFGISMTLFILSVAYALFSVRKAGKPQHDKEYKKLWGHTIQSSISRFAVGI